MYKNKEGNPDPIQGYDINGVRWEELQKMREQRYGIKRGEILIMYFRDKSEDGQHVKHKKEKMKVVELYRHHVLLESSKGIKRCMSYWELNRYLQKPGGDSNGEQTIT